MKKFFISISVFVLALCFLLACDSQGTYEDGHAAGYASGYSDAECVHEDDYIVGYVEGINRAQNSIEVYLEDDMLHLYFSIASEYGIYPDDAIGILEEYLDDPDSISETELHNAIYAICRCYLGMYEIIHCVDDYWID